MHSRRTPDAAFARDIATKSVGEAPREVRRFTTGSHHYVFEALFENNAPIVVRIAAGHSRSAMIGASTLSHRLRPQGIPLPRIIAEDLSAEFAYIVLERLPGRDLRDVIGQLTAEQARVIAGRIVDAQNVVSRSPSVGLYGYAVEPKDAPCESWSAVLDRLVARSRERIISAKIFNSEFVDLAASLIEERRSILDRLPSIPFLHDTTTKNVIVTEDGMFSGIVDVDDLCFGDPRFVAALTLAALKYADAPTRYAFDWMELAGFEDDRIFRLYVALFILVFMSEQGQRFNDNPLSSQSCTPERLIRLFAGCLNDVTA